MILHDRIKESWDANQEVNEERLHAVHIDPKSIVIALGVFVSSDRRIDMDYDTLTKEELLGLLDDPDQIETGGEPWEMDDDREYEIKQIKNILVDKYGIRRKDL